MTLTAPHAIVSAALIATALVGAGCSAPQDAPMETAQVTTAQAEARTVQTTDETTTPAVRPRDERAFLDDLRKVGVPTDSATDTTVEVGIGICRGIAEGSGTDEILDHIRPLTSALAAQTGQSDTDQVGRALVDASRAHLCG